MKCLIIVLWGLGVLENSPPVQEARYGVLLPAPGSNWNETRSTWSDQPVTKLALRNAPGEKDAAPSGHTAFTQSHRVLTVFGVCVTVAAMRQICRIEGGH